MLAALEHLEHEHTTVACNKFYARGPGDLTELERRLRERRLHRSVGIPYDEQLAGMLDTATYQLDALERPTRMAIKRSGSPSASSSSDAPGEAARGRAGLARPCVGAVRAVQNTSGAMSFTFGFLVGDLVGGALGRPTGPRATGIPPAPRPPPAGWYADPAGSSWWRWWDGQQWTAHVAPPAPSAPSSTS